jgi:predicted chitinase
MIITNGKPFFDGYRKNFGSISQSQVDGLNALLKSFAIDPLLTDVRHAAYMLATVWRETDQTYKPITEYGGVSYFNKYNGRNGNTAPGDGFKYRGRGYVQLTFKNNYARASGELSKLTDRYPDGVDLVGNPGHALDPQIAGDIMLIGMREGWFTSKKLLDYINANRTDYVNARKIINGLDHAVDIADAAEKYEAILRAAQITAPADMAPSADAATDVAAPQAEAAAPVASVTTTTETTVTTAPPQATAGSAGTTDGAGS